MVFSMAEGREDPCAEISTVNLLKPAFPHLPRTGSFEWEGHDARVGLIAPWTKLWEYDREAFAMTEGRWRPGDAGRAQPAEVSVLAPSRARRLRFRVAGGAMGPRRALDGALSVRPGGVLRGGE